jgi:peptidase M28-like protein
MRIPGIALVGFAVAACGAIPAQTGPNAFDGKQAFEHVRQLVAIGPRVAGTPGAARARDYIRKELTALGLTVQEQAFDASTPKGVVHMINVIATIPARAGSTAQGRLVIGGHYDTKLFEKFTFVGANDGGSSAAFLIELARAIKGRPHELPIELLFLDGEESVVEWQGTDHTYGSRYYVSAARKANTLKDVRAFILVDMIGDKNLQIMRESNSTPWLTDAIWSAARQLKRPEFIEPATEIEDDHIEFLEAGIQAVDLIDLQYPDASSRYWHTAEDTLDKVSANSLQAVGDVLVAALPAIEKRLADPNR